MSATWSSSPFNRCRSATSNSCGESSSSIEATSTLSACSTLRFDYNNDKRRKVIGSVPLA